MIGLLVMRRKISVLMLAIFLFNINIKKTQKLLWLKCKVDSMTSESLNYFTGLEICITWIIDQKLLRLFCHLLWRPPNHNQSDLCNQKPHHIYYLLFFIKLERFLVEVAGYRFEYFYYKSWIWPNVKNSQCLRFLDER